jgi:hypothetical protein
MTQQAGLWIDHRQAIIILVTDHGEEIKPIMSNVEKQLRRTGSRPLEGKFSPQHVLSDDRKMRSYNAELNRFYDEVIAVVQGAETLLLFGPGMAKNELKKRLEENGLGDRIAALETVDIMTNPQIAAKVRDYFAKG